MNFHHNIANAIIFGSLVVAPAALLAADQLQTRDQLHASEVTTTQLQTQQRERLHVQDSAVPQGPATSGSRATTRSRSQAREIAATSTSTQTRAQQRNRIHK